LVFEKRMSQAIVGRILWKEARVQRAFWVWILGLGLFIQLLPALFGQSYSKGAADLHWFDSVNVVVACCFALGSTAIAFAGETENRTKSLFQRLPVRARELLAGKLVWCVLGTYALVLILSLTARAWAAEGAENFPTSTRSRPELASSALELWQPLLMPLPFLLVGVLGSLTFRDVLTTVAVAGVATAVLLGIETVPARSWFINPVVLVGILAAVAVCDTLLVRNWLRDALAIPSIRDILRPTGTRAEEGHSTLGVRSSVAWRRAASSLFWKELRQAAPFTAMMAVGGAAVLIAIHMLRDQSLREFRDGWGSLVQTLLPIFPLPFGVAAARADRRDGSYRLLARIGVSPNYHWVIKHAVWLGLALATTLCLLGCDELLLRPFRGHEPQSLWQVAERLAIETFNPPAHVATTLGVVVFDVLLIYSLGALLSLVIPSAMTSLVVGLIGWVGLAVLWYLAALFEVPFWWTIALIPLIFLFASWVRTHDWFVDRNSFAAWRRFAASLVLPLLAIWCGVAIFRVVQIPAVSLPLELTAPPPVIEARPLKQSLFVDAIKAITEGPPRENRGEQPTVNDWEHFDFERKYWVDANTGARQLALKAAQQPPGDFEGIEVTRTPTKGGFQVQSGPLTDRVPWLTTLLLDWARKLEFEGKLEDAFSTYVALARFGEDLSRSNRIRSPWRTPAMRLMALAAMDRWAAHPKQTAELIKRAIDRFRRFEEDAPLESPEILNDWRTERRMFVDVVWKGNSVNPQNRTAAETGFVRWCLPWELLRLQRVQDAAFSRDLDEMQIVERELHDRGFVDASLITTNAPRTRPFAWSHGTLEPPIDSPNAFQWDEAAERRVNQAARSSLHFLVWAATDYRREHHRLPDTLSELVPTYFAALPIDPWTGREFLYEPNGVPNRLRPTGGEELVANQPFVASAGASDCRLEVNKTRAPELPPVRVIMHNGLVNAALHLEVLDFPAPAVAIPGGPGEPKPVEKASPKPADKPTRARPGKPTTQPADKLLAKPAGEPPGKTPSKR
jgi:hypothetical protein